MGCQRITNLQCDGLQKEIVIEKRLQLRLESFCVSKYFFVLILCGKTTFAYPFIQFFLKQCLCGGEMLFIFLYKILQLLTNLLKSPTIPYIIGTLWGIFPA